MTTGRRAVHDRRSAGLGSISGRWAWNEEEEEEEEKEEEGKIVIKKSENQ